MPPYPQTDLRSLVLEVANQRIRVMRYRCATDRQNSATDSRHNGATQKCRNRGLEQDQDWAIFAPSQPPFWVFLAVVWGTVTLPIENESVGAVACQSAPMIEQFMHENHRFIDHAD